MDIHSLIKKNIGSISNSALGKAVLNEFKDYITLLVKVIEPCFPPEEYNMHQNTIKGAELPVLSKDHPISMSNHPNLIRFDSKSSKYDGILIIFRRHGSEPPLPEDYVHDFALIMDGGFNYEDLANYIKEEDDIIKQEKKNSRLGAASGRMSVADSSKKHSECTDNNSSLFYTSGRNTGLQVLYESKIDHTIKHNGLGCKETHMRTVHAREKTMTAKQSKARRGILADTGMCCIATLASLDAFRFKQPKVSKKSKITFLSKLGNIIKKHQREGRSDARDVIADFMCLYETTHNYSTNAAHVDGHGPEVLNVFSRHNTTMSSNEAYLYFPLYNIVLVFQVNTTTSVGNLTSTIHMADRSRDNITFSISQWVASC